jgi:ParB-like chromosome segregation protein Spo0J
MRANGPYQMLDPLSPEDFAALEADILERGVMVAIEFDEDGNVIDGHHRLMICEKHGITDYPTVVRRGWTEGGCGT